MIAVSELQYTGSFPLSDQERVDLLEFAVALAVKAGEATLPFFRGAVEIENKLTDGRYDPVTQADTAAEKIIRGEIEQIYPTHGIFGEEFGHQPGQGLTWVIDPIDGTRSFMSGLLHWGLLLALFDGQRPVLGVMYQPYTREVFCGDGRSAEFRCGGHVRLLQTRSCAGLEDAVLATTSPRLFEVKEDLSGFKELEKRSKLTRYGGDCYIYAMLAMGYIDLATDAQLKPYDIQALIPIIEGAGGAVSTYQGGDACMGGTVLAAGSPDLLRSALAAIST